MSGPDDQNELIDRAQAGETAAFEQIVDQHAAPLWRCALVLGQDSHWAEDLAQETLLEAWRSLARFDPRQGRFSTWLFGILRHRFLKGRRRKNAVLIGPEGLEQTPSAAGAPDEAAESTEDAARIRQAVASLPAENRLVVELRFFAGASLEEIASALECPLGTVKSRLHYGLEKLRKMNLAVNLFASAREPQGRKL